MKILKYILFVIIGIVALVLIAAAIMDKSYSLTKEVTINRPAMDVYNYMRMHSNQVEWSAWYKMDTLAKMEITGTDGEVGSAWHWDSEVTGKGEQKIVALEPGAKIACELHFIKPFEGLATNDVTFESIDSTHTIVRNTFSGSSPYPMNIMSLCNDMMIGTPMQDGLNNIKAIMEK
ncbi:MAG: SRPBCC family protein [Bacteroidota bacterium]